MNVLYEDNHIIIVNKQPGELVQGDCTGDKPLSETVADFLKVKYNKPGNVFVGVVHRLDRPVAGPVIFAKTSKALTRLNNMLRDSKIHKTYWALVEGIMPRPQGRLEDRLVSDGRINKTFRCKPSDPNGKNAVLEYKVLAAGHRYSLVEINLITGRKHQIRAQLSLAGHPIKGDLKYGARRSNRDGSISLMAKKLKFEHPVSHNLVEIEVSPTEEMLKIQAAVD